MCPVTIVLECESTHTCTHTHTHTHTMHTHTHTHAHTRTHTRTHTHKKQQHTHAHTDGHQLPRVSVECVKLSEVGDKEFKELRVQGAEFNHQAREEFSPGLISGPRPHRGTVNHILNVLSFSRVLQAV